MIGVTNHCSYNFILIMKKDKLASAYSLFPYVIHFIFEYSVSDFYSRDYDFPKSI